MKHLFFISIFFMVSLPLLNADSIKDLSSLTELRDDFQKEKGKVRIVTLLSPT